MGTRLNNWAIIFCLTLFCPSSWAQEDYIVNVESFGVEEGLSHREIFDIHQDRNGFIWLATKYGLNRFDGQNFRWWTKEKNGLSTNDTRFIIEDDAGYLWAFTTPTWHFKHEPTEANLISTHTGEVISFEERFGNEMPFKVNELTSFLSDENRTLYFSTFDGRLFSFSSNESFREINTPLDQPFYLESCTPDGGFWITLGNPSAKRLYKIALLGRDGEMKKEIDLGDNEKEVEILFTDDDGDLWYYTYQENEPAEVFVVPTFGHQEKCNIPHLNQAFQDIAQTWDKKMFQHPQSGNLWIEGEDYLKVFQPEKGLIIDFLEGQTNVLEANVQSIFSDKDGTVWLGTAEGLFRLILQPNRFRRYMYKDYRQYQGSTSFSCRGIWADKKELQANTYKGRATVDLKNGAMHTLPYIPFSKNNGSETLLGYAPLAIFEDAAGNIWLGENVLIKQDEKTGKEIIFPWDKSVENEPGIWSIYQDDSGKIWVGTDHGLGSLDTKTQTLSFEHKFNVENRLSDDHIYAFVESQRGGHIWLCTSAGLYAWKQTGEILERWWTGGENRFSIPHDNVLHLHEAKGDTLWLATGGGGLVQLMLSSNENKVKNGHYRQFTIADGLSNNNLHGIYEDENQNLWMSSDYGIIQFNQRSLRAKAYLPKDGVTHQEFNRISHFQANDGTLYFGGLNGVTAFHPSSFYAKQKTLAAPLQITDFQQFDSKLNQLVNRTEELQKMREITLRSGDRFFRLEFALLEYQDADQIRYAWKVEGHDKQWNHVRENFIRVSGLPPGSYTLKVKGQAGNGEWSSNEIHLPVTVLRAFYEKTSFWILSTLFLLIGSFLLYKWRTWQLKKRQTELEKAVRARTETVIRQAEELAQLDQLKSRFFANVSHELRTPLTLMLGPIGSALKNNGLDIETFTYLKLAKQNGQKLLELVNEILDLSKMEAGKLELQEKPVALFPFMRRITAQFESHAQYRDIELTFDFQAEPILQVQLDAPKFKIVLNNLLSNALKFSPVKGKIRLSLTDEGNALRLIVSDTGLGIHPDDLPYVFDRFYQSKQLNAQAQGGTGIGLALCREYANLFGGKISVQSQLGEGADFIFEFPKKEVFGAVEDGLWKIEQNGQPEIMAPMELTGQTNNAPLPKVLLVEDNFNLREYIEMVLSGKYRVETAENGQVALDKLQSNGDCQLIISDVMMPVMDGFQFLEKLKNDDRWRHLPVIMLTARAELRDKLKALRIGVDDYMLKPFEEEELMTRMENLLNNSKERQHVAVVPEAENEKPTLSKVDSMWLQEQEKLLKEKLTNTNFTAAIWAAGATMSERHLQRKLKKLTGLSPHQYLNEVRLLEARKLLEDRSFQTVAEVAYAVGFSNPQSFTRNFRKRFGRVPSGYF